MNRRAGIYTTAITLIAIGLGFFWHSRITFSATVERNSRRVCGNQRPCTFRFGQVFPGDWDEVVIFDLSADQNEIDRTIGKGIARPDLERLIVFRKRSKVVRHLTEAQGVEHPTAGEVFFDQVPLDEHHIVIGRNDRFVYESGARSCENCITLMKLKPGQAVQ